VRKGTVHLNSTRVRDRVSDTVKGYGLIAFVALANLAVWPLAVGDRSLTKFGPVACMLFFSALMLVVDWLYKN